MSLAAVQERIAADTLNIEMQEGQLDVHVRQAVARMVAWCERQPLAAAFLARGFVIDTMGDIGAQVRDYFPATIDVSPVIDDVSFVVGQNAKQTKQRFQELELAYVADGKLPEVSDSNIQSFVKWYSVENAVGGDFGGVHNVLKPGYSAGAAGGAGDLLKLLNLGSKKGFLLQVRTLDISDAKTMTLLANMEVVQAFGGSPEAVAEAADVIAQGGPEAKALTELGEKIIEIKTLRAELAAAGDTPAATPIAAALAIKTEALSAKLTSTVARASVRHEISRQVGLVKTDLAARQIGLAVTVLSTSLPKAAASRFAQDLTAGQASVMQVTRAVQAVEVMARTQNMPVREMAALTIAGTASATPAASLHGLTTMLSQPQIMPALAQAAPAAAAQVYEIMTTPVLQQAASDPVAASEVAHNLSVLAEQTQLPTVQMAAEAVAAPAPAAQPALQAPMYDAVAENLRALALTGSVPEAAKPQLIAAAAQVEVLAVQARAPSPEPLPVAAQPVPAQAPLAVLADAVQAPLPPVMTPPPVADMPAMAAQAPRAVDMEMRAENTGSPKAYEVPVQTTLAEAPRGHTHWTSNTADTAQSATTTADATPMATGTAAMAGKATAQGSKADNDNKDASAKSKCGDCVDQSKGCCKAFKDVVAGFSAVDSGFLDRIVAAPAEAPKFRMG